MVAANKLLHLLEVFSSPWFLFCSPVNHHLVFFLLEVFNNIIQYQFDGKLLLKLHHCCKYSHHSRAGSSLFKWLIKCEAAKVCLFECKSFYPKTWFHEAFVFTYLLKSGNFNLVYSIIRKRNLFHQLANLPTDINSIQKALQKKSRSNSTHNAVFMETNNPYNTACSEGPYKTTPVQTGTLNASLKAMPRTQPTSSYTVALFHLSMLTIKSPVAVSIHIYMQILKCVIKSWMEMMYPVHKIIKCA